MKINGEEWVFIYRIPSHSVFRHVDGRELTHWLATPIRWECRGFKLLASGTKASEVVEKHTSLRRKSLTKELQHHLDQASVLRAELAKMGGGRG